MNFMNRKRKALKLKKWISAVLVCGMILTDGSFTALASGVTDISTPEEGYLGMENGYLALSNGDLQDVSVGEAKDISDGNIADVSGNDDISTGDTLIEIEAEKNADVSNIDVSDGDSAESSDVIPAPEVSEEIEIVTAGENIASGHVDNGTEQGVDWVIDADGNLTVTGTGDINNEWWIYSNYVKTATIQVTGDTSGASFKGYKNLISVNLNGYDASHVADMSNMFYNCNNLENIAWGKFNTSNVTNMESMFSFCSSLKSLNLSGFDTSNVTDMGFMFSNCSNLKSLNLSGFDTSNVTDMSFMFCHCDSLEYINLSMFVTSNVIKMEDMFYECSSLKSLDINNFITSNVTTMDKMFYNCSSLKSLDLSNFNTSNVTRMNCMFSLCRSLEDLNVSNFDTSNLVSMEEMFFQCNSLKNLDLSSFNTSNVRQMRRMFANCYDLKNLNISKFDTSNVTSMSGMFGCCDSLQSLDVSQFDTSNVTNMGDMFWRCGSLKNLDLSKFDTSNVTLMGNMFWNCSGLESLDLSSFYTSNVTDMHQMFSGCSSLKSLDISQFDTAKVTEMSWMFYDCSNLKSLDLSSFDTSNVKSMYCMFRKSGIERLDLSNFDTSNVTNMGEMFHECHSLVNLNLSSFNLNNVTYTLWMFSDCNSLAMISTPGNIPNSLQIDLPEIKGATWYRSDTNEKVVYLPTELNQSIVLVRQGGVSVVTAMYNVSFNPLNGSGVTTKTVVSGKTTSLPKAPTMSGYTFGGWFTEENGAGTQFTAKTKVYADTTVYAKWVENTYNIVFNKNGGKIVDAEALAKKTNVAYYTGAVALPGTPGETKTENVGINKELIYRDCYMLTGWNTNAKGTGIHYELGTTVNALCAKNKGTVTLYAEWSPITYTITYILNGEAGTPAYNNAANPDTHSIVKAVSLKAPVREGFTFGGWYTDPTFTKKITAIPKTSTEDITVYAKWTENVFAVVFNKNGGKIVDTMKLEKIPYVFYTGEIELPGKPGEDKYQNVGINDNLLVRSGYILTGWNTNAQGTGIHYDLGATVSKIYTKNKGKMTLYAEWTPIVYTITYDLNDTLEDPAVNHAANAYAYSIVKAPTLKNPARTGYTFGGWYQDDEFLNRVKSIKKADGIDYILYAKWTENVYSVTFNSNGGKVLDKDAVAKKAGIKYTENITLPEASALDRPGYVFTGWNTKKNGTGNWYMDGMEANRIGSKNKGNVVLYAQWMKID